MKKTSIKYIVGGSLVAAGLIIACIAAALGGFRAINGGMYFTWDRGIIFDKEDCDINMEVTNVKNIDIDISAAMLDVSYGNVDQIEINTKNTLEGDFKAFEKNGTLYIQYGKGFHLFSFGFDSQTRINMVIPQGTEFDNVTLDHGVGDGNIDGLLAKNINLENGVGKLKLSNCKSQTLVTDNGVGECVLTDVETGDLTLKSGVGSISYRGKANGNIFADSGVGEIRMDLDGNVNDYIFSIDKGVGDVRVNGNNAVVNNTGAKYTFNIHSGVGAVNITIA